MEQGSARTGINLRFVTQVEEQSYVSNLINANVKDLAFRGSTAGVRSFTSEGGAAFPFLPQVEAEDPGTQDTWEQWASEEEFLQVQMKGGVAWYNLEPLKQTILQCPQTLLAVIFCRVGNERDLKSENSNALLVNTSTDVVLWLSPTTRHTWIPEPGSHAPAREVGGQICRKLTPAEESLLVAMRRRGMSFSEISRALNRSALLLACEYTKLVSLPDTSSTTC